MHSNNLSSPSPNILLTKYIAQATPFIAAGRVVAFPSGTSYGLAVDATQGYALQRLRNLKGRPQDQSFTVMLHQELWSEYLSLTAPELEFLAQLSGQSLTLLLKPQSSLAHLSVDGLVGLRLIDHPLMEELCRTTAVPLTATSANRTGEPPCLTPACLQATFPALVADNHLDEPDPKGASHTTYNLSLAAIIDGGSLPPCQPTTIIRIDEDNRFTIIRAGGLSADDIKKFLP